MRKQTCLFGLTLFILLASRGPVGAQQGPSTKKPPSYPYKLIDIGTFGGPISYQSANFQGSRILNNAGVVSSYADTTAPDPFAPDFCFDADCLVAHAYRWHDGVLQDLGVLANGYSSLVASINDLGWGIGAAETGIIDSAAGLPQNVAVLWKDHKMLSLGTLPGGSESLGISINNAGQAIGISNNGIPDPYAPIPLGSQNRTFLWEHGRMTDIGTLGGPDALPGSACDNQRPDTIVGNSYTSFTPNAGTGVPTMDPFLWENGTMIDLGNLGGTSSTGQCLNTRGEVIGESNLPGDQIFHAFLWRNGHMQDLGTLGGDTSQAIWINDTGEIAGVADLPTPHLHHAVVWRHEQIYDLGTVAGDACSSATAINSRNQVVGTSTDCMNALHAFVWEAGSPMRDLNTLIAPGSGLELTRAIDINDRGEILAQSRPVGTSPSDDDDLGHVVLLIPCRDIAHQGNCSSQTPSNNTATAISPPEPSTLSQRSKRSTAITSVWRMRLSRLSPAKTTQTK
jgi:probable HAF family extracellular repeat protein